MQLCSSCLAPVHAIGKRFIVVESTILLSSIRKYKWVVKPAKSCKTLKNKTSFRKSSLAIALLLTAYEVVIIRYIIEAERMSKLSKYHWNHMWKKKITYIFYLAKTHGYYGRRPIKATIKIFGRVASKMASSWKQEYYHPLPFKHPRRSGRT